MTAVRWLAVGPRRDDRLAPAAHGLGEGVRGGRLGALGQAAEHGAVRHRLRRRLRGRLNVHLVGRGTCQGVGFSRCDLAGHDARGDGHPHHPPPSRPATRRDLGRCWCCTRACPAYGRKTGHEEPCVVATPCRICRVRRAFSRLFDSRRCRFSFMKPHPGRRPADARGWYRRRVLPRPAVLHATSTTSCPSRGTSRRCRGVTPPLWRLAHEGQPAVGCGRNSAERRVQTGAQ